MRFTATALFQLLVASGIHADFSIWSNKAQTIRKVCSSNNQTCACVEDSATPIVVDIAPNDEYFQMEPVECNTDYFILDAYFGTPWLVYVHDAQYADEVGQCTVVTAAGVEMQCSDSWNEIMSCESQTCG